MTGSFTVSGGDLAAAVKYAARWLDPRPLNPVQGGLLIRAAGGTVEIAGLGEQASARATVPVDDIGGSDRTEFVVAGRLMTELVGTFPSKPVTFDLNGPTVTLTVGSTRATMPVFSAKDYPRLPDRATTAGVVDGGLLAEAVRRVKVAARRDAGEKAAWVTYTGVHFTLGTIEEPDRLELLTCDRYRSVRQYVAWKAGAEGAALGGLAHVPVGVLTEAASDFAGGQVEIGWSEGAFSLSTPTRALVTRTLDFSQFPAEPCRRILDATKGASARLRPADLLPSLKRAELFSIAKDRENAAVTLAFSEGIATVSTSTSERGDADDEIEIEYDGPDASLDLSAAKLRDALAGAPPDVVVMSFDPRTKKPVVFTSPADPGWRHMVQPLGILR